MLQLDKKNVHFRSENILIFNDDILKITDIPKNFVGLIITSPPYNVDIHYNSNKDNLDYDEYLEFSEIDVYDWVKGNLRYFDFDRH